MTKRLPAEGGGRADPRAETQSAATNAATTPRIEREAEIRALAATNGRRKMSDGEYSTVLIGWKDIHMLLDEIDRLRGLHK